MTEQEQIAYISAHVNDSSVTETIIKAYIADAKDAVLKRLYPFKKDATTVPSHLDVTVCKLAVRYILRRGGEGELSHSENGVSRSYGSVDDSDILGTIVPYVKLGETTDTTRAEGDFV